MIKTKKEYDELPIMLGKYYKTAGLYRIPGDRFNPVPPLYKIYEVLRTEKVIIQHLIKLKDEKNNK